MTIITKENGRRQLEFDSERIHRFLNKYTTIKDQSFAEKVIRSIESHETYKATSITDLMINTALENVDELNPEWTFEAAKIYLTELYKEASRNRSYSAKNKYGDFYGLLKKLGSEGIYSPVLLEKYSYDEIIELSDIIDPSKDLLFNYPGLYTLATRYLITDHDKNVYELPQERWMVIAMYLMQDESSDVRLNHVKEAYWALSNLYMTVATPTLANAGKANGQLSSCFIDTIDDSLQSIYDSNTDIAKLSKNGGGIGAYIGKVRARGSSIRGYKGMSSGVVPWIKQLNNTAVSVDQLGTRKGAIAIYLDVWHKDIPSFLDLRLNNGDDRQRAHDIFTGVCLPDYFMEQVEKRGDWYLFDPHEVREVMGFSLEDFYDEKKGEGSFREKYEECVRNNNLSKEKVLAVDIMKRLMKSQLESGTPFMFYRDEVNRMNPNSHQGIIYCSNLCSEITENQSPTEFIEEYIENENTIVKKYSPGDYVVCNLSSINLGRAVPEGVLGRLIPIQVRMLDNVISTNNLPILQAEITNKKYRAIGLGTFGWHHLLALKGIRWETEESVKYADTLYEEIAYLSIKSSMELSKEKGAYPLFEGSDWNTGQYFEKRGYLDSECVRWSNLLNDVKEHGIRNAYLMAVAPNGSTSVIAGSTASIDPIFQPFFYEEKKDFKLPIVAPELDFRTYDVYQKSAYKLDQFWSIKQNAARQRHIDQSQSFNLYVPNTIRAKVLLELHIQAWKQGLKTTYYVRSTSSDIEECEWCQ
ncbi:ribonucleoside-diphosphate reductase subunit alpha [Oceanobacillus kimchii]|uniref:Ribonucleoside-diphosphate reductase n=1 Tax=Oceanobacillus kimchii TaxID=746691 RepID=A0ABQ5TIG4_9BACI|nr:ribonucleoside-diphosphate reductase subunit alpha [Oceanobacillus kimchii]GLO66260.1 ribonucleoside-diphosphate reductase [Oceanobacillus kimchii]